MPYWEGYQRQYRLNYRPSSAYIGNTTLNYLQNVLQPQLTYKPPFTLNNAYQPNVGGQNSNQA